MTISPAQVRIRATRANPDLPGGSMKNAREIEFLVFVAAFGVVLALVVVVLMGFQ